MAKINTACGQIAPEDLGITLPHEHLLIDVSCWFVRPKDGACTHLINSPVTIDILGDLRRNSNCCLENLKLTNADDATSELMMFKNRGGKTLVDLTIDGVGRDPLALRDISLATGVNVVVGSGWYIEGARPEYLRSKSADELVAIIVKELTEGIGTTEIRAGVIGEIGFSSFLTELDKKILKVVAKAQARTGAALTIHPATENDEQNRRIRQLTDYLDVLEGEGANLRKVYMSHTDYFIHDMNYVRAIIDKYDITAGIDQFFVSTFYDSIWPGYGPPEDEEKTKAVIDLVKSGYGNRVMISHDICLKHHLVKYGGYGYAHILKTIIPMLRYAGIGNREIDTILVDNPRDMFAF